MEIKEFMDTVEARYLEIITDEIFCFIQNDKLLMNEYLRLVEKNGKDTLNRAIGKEIKQRFKLTNSPLRSNTPKSTLIQSYQIFE